MFFFKGQEPCVYNTLHTTSIENNLSPRVSIMYDQIFRSRVVFIFFNKVMTME